MNDDILVSLQQLRNELRSGNWLKAEETALDIAVMCREAHNGKCGMACTTSSLIDSEGADAPNTS